MRSIEAFGCTLNRPRSFAGRVGRWHHEPAMTHPLPAARYTWNAGEQGYTFDFAFVRGTHDHPYAFGERAASRAVEIQDFLIGTVPVTQALWIHVMGSGANPSLHQGPDLPIENVSWDDMTRPGGFLDRVNESPALAAKFALGDRKLRLPSETEWEYAARGGPHWLDGFKFSGSDDVD